MTLNPRILLTSTLLPTTVLALVACSNEEASIDVAETTSSSITSSELQAPPTLSALIVEKSLTPAGFEYIPPTQEGEPSLGELFGIEDSTGGLPIENNTFAPSQCAGVHMDSLTLLSWMMEPTDTTATASYISLDNDEEGIFVKVTSIPADLQTYPTDLGECSAFTRNMAGDGEQGILQYSASPADIAIDGAQVLVAANTTLEGASLNGLPINADGIGQGFQLVTAVLDNITFSVVAPVSIPTDTVTTIVNEQASRIAASHN